MPLGLEAVLKNEITGIGGKMKLVGTAGGNLFWRQKVLLQEQIFFTHNREFLFRQQRFKAVTF